MESGDTVRAVSLCRLILSGMELRSAKRTNMRLSVCLGHLLCVREIQVLSPESLFRAMPNFLLVLSLYWNKTSDAFACYLHLGR